MMAATKMICIGTTISFEIMMRELKIQLGSTHYVHKYRGFVTLDHVPQFDLCMMITANFCGEEFETAHDFAKKTNSYLAKIIRRSNGYRKEELKAMKTILIHSCWELEYHEERIKVEIEKEKFMAMLDDQDDEMTVIL